MFGDAMRSWDVLGCNEMAGDILRCVEILETSKDSFRCFEMPRDVLRWFDMFWE